jgi:cytochrome c oxidase assembly factor CtaG/putative copper export protein
MGYVPVPTQAPHSAPRDVLQGRRTITPGWLAAAAGAAVAALVLALLFSGAAGEGQLGDPGALTRWGLPLLRMLNNIAVAAVIGALVFAVVIVPHHARTARDGGTVRPAGAGAGGGDSFREHPGFVRAVALAAGASVVWTVAAAGVLVLTYSSAAGIPLTTGPEFSGDFGTYLTGFPAGRAWLATAAIAAVTALLIFAGRSLAVLAWALLLALAGLVPAALVSHAAGGDDHYGAVSAFGLHLVGVCLWFGGVIALAVVSGALGQAAPAVLRRFSALAGFAFVLVFVSGVINTALRVSSLAELATEWGILATVKAVATLVLGLIGLLHRQWAIPRLPAAADGGAQRLLWRLVAAELVLMCAVSGIAVALGRTAPPAVLEPAGTLSPARLLTGYELPPELTPERWLTQWRPDWLWVAFAAGAAVAYVLGMLKVRRRGDAWPAGRLVSWTAGLAALTYFTSGPPAVYGMVLFSAHMVDHMALTMVVPLFLVLGAPVTLALKALQPRGDGSRGIREWILVLVHSRFSALLTHPLFAAANFVGSIVVFYYSPLFGFALRQHVGHELMNLHFLLTGYIFVLTMIGTDPVPRRAAYPLRLLLLFSTMAFHAFFGVALNGSTSLLQASWFGNMGRAWGPTALEDQRLGGAWTWGIGEVPTLLVAIGVAMMWSRSDARENRRMDRAAERNNDAELTAYNNMFAALAERDRSQASTRNETGDNA